jgi:RHS repeat-associated protein
VEACDTTATENYAVVAGFTAHGAARDVQLGNLLWEHAEYNSRLQATDLRLGTSQGSSEKWRLENGYSLTANNGNVMSQTLAPLNVTQSFQYDGVNRLKVASEGAAWSWTFDYDKFGNQWVSEWSGLSPGSLTATASSWYDAQNRMTVAPSAQFDEAGNQTHMGGYTFGYDAEGRVKDSTISGATTSYAYDGQGRRVKKALGSNTRVFVYDAAGQLAAEYSTGEPTEFGTSYLTADHLGSTRVVTDANGEVTERHDYRPFGEELFAGVSGRTADLKYSGGDTGVRLKFTGKERDAETGLDYFGARYFSAAQGRFTSPDPKAFHAGHIANPQKWNAYAYVLNNPLALIDPDGMEERRRIDVFLNFPPSERNTWNGRVQSGPNWSGLQASAARSGFDVNVHAAGSFTIQDVATSVNTAEATVVIGHGRGYNDAVPLGDGSYARRHVTTHIEAPGGQINEFGVVPTANGQATGPAGPKPTANAATCLLLCNSADKLPNAFSIKAGSALVVNTGRADGLTRVGTLEQAGFALVGTYVRTGGNVQRSTASGQRVITNSPVKSDQDNRLKIIP